MRNGASGFTGDVAAVAAVAVVAPPTMTASPIAAPTARCHDPVVVIGFTPLLCPCADGGYVTAAPAPPTSTPPPDGTRW